MRSRVVNWRNIAIKILPGRILSEIAWFRQLTGTSCTTYIAVVKPTVCLLIAILPVLLGAVDEQSVAVRSVSIDSQIVVVIAELQGKPTQLTCMITDPSCSKPQPGEYSMVRAARDEAVYQDCTNVVLYNNSSGTKREKVGVYCWLGSADCRIVSCLERQVDTLPATIQEEPLRITEPSVYQISDLFNAADVVAVVKILSGDTENYDHAVYKGEVIKGFKGVPSGATVYFGPFVGERLGWEYFLFLRNAAKPVAPKTTASASYGTIQYSEIFNQGYSSMESSYECVFDGKEIAQKCDYGVRVCTDYLKAPQSISVFPKENYPPFGCGWARKAAFVSLLDTLAVPKK